MQHSFPCSLSEFLSFGCFVPVFPIETPCLRLHPQTNLQTRIKAETQKLRKKGSPLFSVEPRFGKAPTSKHHRNRPPQANPEGTEFAMVAGTLDRFSSDISTLIGIDTITNMQSLRAEYSLRFPKRPPLFFAAPLKPVFPRDSEYQLPARDFYWLKEWSTNDSSDTPLFWSYFHIPNH